VLSAHPRGSPPCSLNRIYLTTTPVKQVNYPKTSPTRAFYDKCRNPNGGYGGLLSATFYSKPDAIAFFDALDTVKGPSLGTNFTLSSPYVILAHYGELDWVSSISPWFPVVRTVKSTVTDSATVSQMGRRRRFDPLQRRARGDGEAG
jgi:hypothetical protein